MVLFEREETVSSYQLSVISYQLSVKVYTTQRLMADCFFVEKKDYLQDSRFF